MSLKLHPYSEYKASKLDGLGMIPAHWQEKSAKYFFREVDERSETGKEELLSVSHLTGVTPRSQKKVNMFMAESTVGYKLCRPDDLVINTLWAWMAALGVSRYTGLVSPAYGVYRPRTPSAILPKYVDYLLRMQPFVSEYIRRSTGVQASRLRLYADQFLRIPILCPSQEEQQAILKYLTAKDLQIGRLIRAKRRLIELLLNQKQVIIYRVVMRGLNDDARLRPSGTQWLSAVPEHWEVLPLKRITTRIEQGWSPQCDAQPAGDDDWGVLKVGCVNGESFDPSENKKLPPNLTPIPELEIRTGDVLVSRANTRSLVGQAALVETVRPRLLLCDKLFRMRIIEHRAIDRFIVYALRASSSRAQIEAAATGASSSMLNIGQGTIQNLSIALPPISEQKSIISAIADQCAHLNLAVSHGRKELDLLREYRIRMIADVVTGKIDVRGIQMSVCENDEPPDAFDDHEDPDEDELNTAAEAPHAEA